MDLFYQAYSMLQQAGFYARVSVPDEGFVFEDETVYGFVRVYPAVEDLLRDWESHQDEFLSGHAGPIRSNPVKAWNAYSVLLTSMPADDSQRGALLKVEEDFRGTRKIATAGLETVEQVKDALLPILPIDIKLEVGSSIEPKLGERLGFLSREETEALFTQDTQKIIAAAMNSP